MPNSSSQSAHATARTVAKKKKKKKKMKLRQQQQHPTPSAFFFFLIIVLSCGFTLFASTSLKKPSNETEKPGHRVSFCTYILLYFKKEFAP